MRVARGIVVRATMLYFCAGLAYIVALPEPGRDMSPRPCSGLAFIALARSAPL